MKEISHIVFDFGGVLLDIDYQHTYSALSSKLDIDFNMQTLPQKIHTLLSDFETGHISAEDFLCRLEEFASNGNTNRQELMDAWNAMLIGFNPAIFDMLTLLRNKYMVYLLSNTNELHLNWVHRELHEKHQITDFETRFFDKTYYSHLVGLKKPDENIYLLVQNDAKLNLAHTLFIDDLLPNIKGAQKAGWNTYHHDPKDDLTEILTKKLDLI